ncbi:hypothetical protein [Nostoc sp.]|uniref:hypothetical protein n=1 Tax=Nostoc sp. TaxID=1180 RepID=UPI002FFA4B88
MKFEVITQVPELTEFNERIFGYTGVKFLIKYWQHCKVVACYNPQQEMIGGYALALEPPFRSLFTLAKTPEHYSKFLEEVSPEQMLEVSAIWLDVEARTIQNKVKLFRVMLDDICEHEKPYFLYVYNINRPYLQKFYGKLNPRVIFQGMLPGAMPNAHPVGIEYVLTAEIKQEIKKAQYRFLKD